MVAVCLTNYIKIYVRRAAGQPWELNIFRVQEGEEEEEPMEEMEEVMRMVEILTNIEHGQYCLACHS